MISKGLIFIGVVMMLYASGQAKRKLDKYEFDHRSSGGVVEFESFEASERHRHLRRIGFYANKWSWIGIAITCIGAALWIWG
jgi:hypothetical protein